MIAIASPIIGKEEEQAVKEVLESGILAQGPRVSLLEERFAQYCGTKFAVAVSSGTAALHAALHAAGIGPGDEVITVPFSFIATINPIIMVGAKPVLVDIEKDTFNLDVRQFEAAITKQTKAIIPVHLYGQPANMEEIRTIAAAHNIVVIEDACQAIGADYKGKKAGALGDMGCFSLYATKNIMCGEGGMITTDNEAFATRMRQFRQHGMSGPYEYQGLGYNYRLTDLQAAIAIEQLKKVDGFTAKRQANAKLMTKALAGIKGITLPTVAADRTHAYHQYTIRLEKNRDEVAQRLRDHDIIAGVYYPKPLHLVPHIAAYGYKPGDFPVSEAAAAEVLSLPIHPNLADGDVDTIASALKESL
jgi:perosamine synthetase